MLCFPKLEFTGIRTKRYKLVWILSGSLLIKLAILDSTTSKVLVSTRGPPGSNSTWSYGHWRQVIWGSSCQWKNWQRKELFPWWTKLTLTITRNRVTLHSRSMEELTGTQKACMGVSWFFLARGKSKWAASTSMAWWGQSLAALDWGLRIEVLGQPIRLVASSGQGWVTSRMGDGGGRWGL